MLSVLIPFEMSYLWYSEFSALFAIEGKCWSKWIWNEKWLCLYWKKMWVSGITLKITVSIELWFLNLIFIFSLQLKLLYLEFKICWVKLNSKTKISTSCILCITLCTMYRCNVIPLYTYIAKWLWQASGAFVTEWGSRIAQIYL